MEKCKILIAKNNNRYITDSNVDNITGNLDIQS